MTDEIKEDFCFTVMQRSEDILDKLFEFLPNTTLGRCAQVCRLWKKVAQRKMSMICLHHVWMPPHVSRHIDFVRQFKVKPNTSLFFCASRPGRRNADNIDFSTLYQYHHQYPHMSRAVVLGVEHAMLDTTEILSCCEPARSEEDVYRASNGVLGINFADRNDMSVKVVWCESNEETSLVDARRAFEQLLPDENKGEPIYLMFGRNGFSTAKNVLTIMRERYRDSQPSVWGGTMADFIKCNDSYPKREGLQVNDYDKWTTRHEFLGILLQSPRLRAHTTVVSLVDDLKARLVEFKTKFSLRRRSLGLVSGPHSIGGMYKKDVFVYKTVMDIIKEQFPKVRFIGYFNGPQLHCYGCDNKHTDKSNTLIHQRTICIMILTFD